MVKFQHRHFPKMPGSKPGICCGNSKKESRCRFCNRDQWHQKEMFRMDKRKKKVLKSKGYKVGSVDEFLGLNKKESDFIELKLALSEALSERRKRSNLTQAQLAKMLKSSQSRVAKMEKGDPAVSLDLLVESLLAMGATKKSIAKVIA